MTTQSTIAANLATPIAVKGAQIQTKETFLYGKFECMMKPGTGSGIMGGSIFTFNDKPGFQNNWGEIGFEILGRNTNTIDCYFIRTANGKKEINVEKYVPGKRCSDTFLKYGFDWNKDRIIWYVNDVSVRVSTTSINIPQKLMLNIWDSNNPGWAGEFNRAMLPQQAEYKYVRYTGPDGRVWQDSFDDLDLNRWQVATWNIEDVQFVKENVVLKDGNLILKLT